MRAPARRIGGLCCCLLFVLAGSVPGRRLRVDLIVGVLAVHGAPTALQGALVGIGFIGVGLVFRQPKGRLPLIRNRTTAAAIFAAAAIGAAAGEGRLLLATVGTALALLVLEVRHIPLLRPLDDRSWAPGSATTSRRAGQPRLRPMIRNARRVIIDAGAPRPSTKSVAAIAHLTTSEDEPVEIGEIKGPVGAAPGWTLSLPTRGGHLPWRRCGLWHGISTVGHGLSFTSEPKPG